MQRAWCKRRPSALQRSNGPDREAGQPWCHSRGFQRVQHHGGWWRQACADWFPSDGVNWPRKCQDVSPHFSFWICEEKNEIKSYMTFISCHISFAILLTLMLYVPNDKWVMEKDIESWWFMRTNVKSYVIMVLYRNLRIIQVWSMKPWSMLAPHTV